jgi:hypothetical protein
MVITILLALAAPVGNPANNASPRASEDRVLCQRETPTGSLITARELCMTKAEWNALEQDYREGGRKLVDQRLGNRPGS